jgi:hypothetical protein
MDRIFCRREVRTMSTTCGTVSTLAQSRCSSHASDTQPIGWAPARTIRSRPRLALHAESLQAAGGGSCAWEVPVDVPRFDGAGLAVDDRPGNAFEAVGASDWQVAGRHRFLTVTPQRVLQPIACQSKWIACILKQLTTLRAKHA